MNKLSGSGSVKCHDWIHCIGSIVYIVTLLLMLRNGGGRFLSITMYSNGDGDAPAATDAYVRCVHVLSVAGPIPTGNKIFAEINLPFTTK